MSQYSFLQADFRLTLLDIFYSNQVWLEVELDLKAQRAEDSGKMSGQQVALLKCFYPKERAIRKKYVPFGLPGKEHGEKFSRIGISMLGVSDTPLRRWERKIRFLSPDFKRLLCRLRRHWQVQNPRKPASSDL